MTYEVNDLISCAVDAILDNNGELSYAAIGKAFQRAMEDVEKLDSVKELLALL